MGYTVKRRSSKESGYMLVMFAITIGLLLSFSALVIDVGQGYLWKQRVDRAARAAALAGLGFRGLTGWEYCNSTTKTEWLDWFQTNTEALIRLDCTKENTKL